MAKIIISSYKDKTNRRVFATTVTNYIFGEPEEEVIIRSSLRLLKRALQANRVNNTAEIFWDMLPINLLRAHKSENPSYVAEHYFPYNSL